MRRLALILLLVLIVLAAGGCHGGRRPPTVPPDLVVRYQWGAQKDHPDNADRTFRSGGGGFGWR